MEEYNMIEEDWEEMKKNLTDLYVAGKITERQISTRLCRAGMGPVAKNVAYKIAHEPDNVQKREMVLQKQKDEEERLQKVEAKKNDANYGKKRGDLAQAYCNAWNERFGHIVKAGVVREALEDLMEEYEIICSEEEKEGLFEEIFEDALNTLDSKKKLLNKEIEMNSKSKKAGFFNY